MPDVFYFSDFLLASGMDFCDNCGVVDDINMILPMPASTGYPRFLCPECRMP